MLALPGPARRWESKRLRLHLFAVVGASVLARETLFALGPILHDSAVVCFAHMAPLTGQQ